MFFLEYLVNGVVDLYYMRRDDEYDCSYIEKEGQPLVLLPYSEDLVVKEEVVGEAPSCAYAMRSSRQHVGLLKYYMKDAPDLTARIDDMGVPSHRNLKKIVTSYHDMVCDGEACIVYKEKEPKTTFYPEINYGLTCLLISESGCISFFTFVYV